MIRRSFRIGLTLGVLGGLAIALAKMLGARPEPAASGGSAPTAPWPRLEVDPALPAPPTVALVRDPAAPPPPEDAPPPTDAPAAVDAPAAAPRPVEPEPAEKAAPAAKTPAKAAKKKAPASKTPAKKRAPLRAWVEPDGDVCPTSHPVKAKLASKIFHLPGMLNYDRTKPDRCYVNGPAAEADGLRAAKR